MRPLGFALACVPVAVLAADLTGTARVIDGDTIAVAGVKLRIQGIAAPELKERGGTQAKRAMAELVRDQVVVCELTGHRTYDREEATCEVHGRDLGGFMVAAGFARDCPHFSGGRYAAAETASARAWLPLPRYCTR